MKDLLDSLLDYSRSSLGHGIAIRRSRVDLAAACEEELAVLRAALPGRQIDLVVTGATEGEFDASRVRESLANLVFNAARYAVEGSPISVCFRDQGEGRPLGCQPGRHRYRTKSSPPCSSHCGEGKSSRRDVVVRPARTWVWVCSSSRKLPLPMAAGSRSLPRGQNHVHGDACPRDGRGVERARTRRGVSAVVLGLGFSGSDVFRPSISGSPGGCNRAPPPPGSGPGSSGRAGRR